MTVQELIDKLNEIEDKSKEVRTYQDGAFQRTDVVIYEYDTEVELM